MKEFSFNLFVLFCLLAFLLYGLTPLVTVRSQYDCLIFIALLGLLGKQKNLISEWLAFVLIIFAIAAGSLSFDELVRFGFQFSQTDDKLAMLQFFAFKVFFVSVGTFGVPVLLKEKRTYIQNNHNEKEG